MRQLNVFNFISLDGYYKDSGNGISWHKHGEEESDYSAKAMKEESVLLFGRITFEMMAGFWPTPMAKQQDPRTAEGMNKAEKIVFSTSLKQDDVTWQNTTVVNEDLVGYIRKLKATSGKALTILGSGTIVTQLAEAGLIDSLQLMVDPVAIGSGTSIFSGLNKEVDFKLTGTHAFKSGTVLLNYKV